jgi:hypothetical protein
VTRRAKRLTVFAFALILAAGVMLTASDPSAPVEAGTACEHLRVVIADLCTHGPDPRTTSSTGTASGSVVCDGDGTSGKRVQVILARAQGSPVNGYPDATALAGGVDSIFDLSAQQTGGRRHVRYVTKPDCTLNVLTLTLPAGADRDFGSTIDALRAQNYNSPGRKYLIFVDASVYCGIGTATDDDRTPWNNADSGTGYARVDRPCWSAPVAAHELAHTLGAVQFSAPHSTGGWHCTDEHDLMCYQDSSSVTMTYPCPAENENRLDCGHDDYLNTAPAAGSYLATHWNLARSGFLIGSPDPGPSPTPRRCLIRLGKTVCLYPPPHHSPPHHRLPPVAVERGSFLYALSGAGTSRTTSAGRVGSIRA